MHLVDRLNQAAAEQLGPNIIDSGTFEERLLAVDRGFNEPFAAAKFRYRYARYFLGRFGRHQVIRRILHERRGGTGLDFRLRCRRRSGSWFGGLLAGQEHRLGGQPLLGLAGVLDFAAGSLRHKSLPLDLQRIGTLEKRRHPPVVFLLPLLDFGVLVTAGALNANSHEPLTDVLGQLFWLEGGAEVVRRPVQERVSGRSKHLPRKHSPRLMSHAVRRPPGGRHFVCDWPGRSFRRASRAGGADARDPRRRGGTRRRAEHDA